MWRAPLILISLLFVPCWAAFDPYADPKWTGGVEFIGEYLKLRPCLCDLDYLISDPRAFVSARDPETGSTKDPESYTLKSMPSGVNQGADPERDNGFRIGVAAVPGRGKRDWSLTYAGLWTRDDRAFLNPTPVNEDTGVMHEGGIWPTFGDPRLLTRRLEASSILGAVGTNIRSATAKAELRTHWSCWDGQMGWRWIQGCDLWMRVFVGVRGTFIQVREHVAYHGLAVLEAAPFITQSQDHSVSARSQAWGIGPRAGVDARFDIAAGVGLGAHFGGGMLVGGRRNDYTQHSVGSDAEPTQSNSAFDERLDGHAQHPCAGFPELDARLGVNYLSCSGNRYFMFVEVGYGLTTFINALNQVSFNNSGGTNIASHRSFTLTGFYVSATLRY